MAREWYSRPINAGYTVVDGTTTGSYNMNYVKTWMEYKETVDQANNRSTVHVLLYSQVIDGGASSNMAVWSTAYDAGWAGYDDGNKLYWNTTYDYNNKHLNKFADNTLTIPHNPDGTKTITLQAGFTTKSSSVTGGSASASVTLTATPQKSVITSVAGANYGYPTTVRITRYASSFREEVRLTGIGIAKQKTNPDADFTFTLPREYTPNTAYPCSATVEFVCETFDGATSLGTTTFNVTYEISPTDIEFFPQFTTPTDVAVNTSVPSLGNDTAVAGFSKINIQAAESDVTLKYNATIVERYVEFADGTVVSGSQTDHISNVIASAGEYAWAYVVKDSRGFTQRYQSTYTVSGVTVPTLDNIQCYRGDSLGVASPTGTYIWAKAEYNYASYNGHNTASATAAIGLDVVSLPHNTLTCVKNNASADTSYTVVLRIDDLLSYSEYSINILSQDIPFNIKKGGNGVAFGKHAEKVDTVEFAYKAVHYEPIIPPTTDGTSADYARYDNHDKGLTTLYAIYEIGGVKGAGFAVLYNETILTYHGFTGLTVDIDNHQFRFGSNTTIDYRIFANNMGDYTPS